LEPRNTLIRDFFQKLFKRNESKYGPIKREIRRRDIGTGLSESRFAARFVKRTDIFGKRRKWV